MSAFTSRTRPLDLTHAGTRVTGRAGQGAGGPAPAPPVPVIFPPEIYPIPGSRNLFASGQASVSNAAVATLCSATLLAAEVARLSVLTFVVNSLTTASLITFAVLQNQGAVQGYGSIPVPPATAATLTIEKQVLIRVPVGIQTLSVTATVAAADAATYVLYAALEGWAWTPELAQRYASGQVDVMVGH